MKKPRHDKRRAKLAQRDKSNRSVARHLERISVALLPEFAERIDVGAVR